MNYKSYRTHYRPRPTTYPYTGGVPIPNRWFWASAQPTADSLQWSEGSYNTCHHPHIIRDPPVVHSEDG